MTTWPRLNLASGPVDVTVETLRAMNRPVLYHYDPAFIDVFERTTGLLRDVFDTRYDVVIMQAEAILGLEAAVASLVEPGTKVLNLVSGVFGKWMEDFIVRYGGDPVELRVPYNAAIDPDDVRRVLDTIPGITVLTVVHSETPSGTINPVREICRIARKYGVITIVDTVSGLGSELLSPEDWAIDVAVAGPQKCLGGTPGLTLMSISPEAWIAMEQRATPLRGSFLSVLDWKTTWIEQRRFPHTPSVSEIYALESVLEQALREGMPAMVARHQASAKAARAAAKALGLTLWAESESIATSCCTAVAAPDGVDESVIRSTLRSRYGLMIAGGYGDLAGKLFRLGHMGSSAHPVPLISQIGLLERTLADLGMDVTLGSGVAAALDAFAGWNDATATYPG
ncbi:MAG TPA: alanine--glyoxylate aminotransferase family protein [Thermomicrobiales bacterium]|nr:alanine--glyoxylate aminotransferase family protein [Thermomicrobiales bacterium]